jgi:hypothetical protein
MKPFKYTKAHSIMFLIGGLIMVGMCAGAGYFAYKHIKQNQILFESGEISTGIVKETNKHHYLISDNRASARSSRREISESEFNTFQRGSRSYGRYAAVEKSYELVWRFPTLSGKVFQGAQDFASYSIFQKYNVGDSIEIYYMKNAPSINNFKEYLEPSTWDTVFNSLLICFIFLFSVPGFLLLRSAWIIEKKLKAETSLDKSRTELD